MSKLDVALTLRLVNQLSGPAKQAAGDLKKLVVDAKGLNGGHGAKLGADLARVSTAAVKADVTLRKLGADAKTGLTAAGTATATFGNTLLRADASAGKLDATVRKLGSSGAGMKALDADAKKLAADMDRAAAASGRASREAARARPARGSGGRGDDHGGGAGHGGRHRLREVAAVAGVGYGIVHLGAEAIRTQARYTHETVRMSAAGMTPHEMEEAERESLALSGRHKAISQTEVMHALRNARSIVGTYEEAAEIMGPMLQLRTIAMGAHPGAGMEEDFDKLIKGLEIKGVTQHLPEFVSYLDGMAKAVNAFGDTLKPSDYYEMFKYGHQATQGLSKEFMLSVAPTIAQELGGASAGVAFSDVFQVLVGGHATATAAKEFAALGLIAKGGAELNKKGQVKKVKAGGIEGSDVAAHDPYQWVQQYLMPALKAHGVTTAEAIQAKISQLFPNQVAAQLISLFSTQQSRIEKDRIIGQNAKGLEAAAQFETKDPFVAWKALKSQLENLVNAFHGMEHAAEVMNAAAELFALAAGAKRGADNDPAKPGYGLGERAQSKLNKWMNIILYGDPSDDAPGIAYARSDERRADAERARGRNRAELEAQQRRHDGAEAYPFDAPIRRDALADSERRMAAARMRLLAIDQAEARLDESIAEYDRFKARLKDFSSIRMRQGQDGLDPHAQGKAKGPGSGLLLFGLNGAPIVATPYDGTTPPARPGNPPARTAPMLRSLDDVLNPAREAAGKVKEAMAVDLSATANAMIGGYENGIRVAGPGAVAAARAIAQQLSATLNITVTPTIAPRLSPSFRPAPGPTSPVPGGGGGSGVVVHEAHFHGVRDPAGMHRELTRMADRTVRDTRSDALHDLGTMYG